MTEEVSHSSHFKTKKRNLRSSDTNLQFPVQQLQTDSEEELQYGLNFNPNQFQRDSASQEEEDAEMLEQLSDGENDEDGQNK